MLGGSLGQHVQTGAGVGHNACNRLIDFVRNRRCQGPEGRDPRHVGEFRSELAERVFRELVRCHILDCANVLQPPGTVPDPVGFCSQVLDSTVRHPQTEPIIVIPDVFSGQLHFFRPQRDVFRMDSSAHALKRHSQISIKLKDAIKLFRERNFVCVQIPGKGAGQVQSLALGEKFFASP